MGKSATQNGRAPRSKKPSGERKKSDVLGKEGHTLTVDDLVAENGSEAPQLSNEHTPAKRGVGRPTLYDPEKHPEQVKRLCLLGITDAQIAKVLLISEATLNSWKHSHPEFLESMREGKEVADANVAAALYHRAVGYSHDDEEIKVVDKAIERVPVVKQYPPDTQAIRLWLMNRQPHLFRERTVTEITGPDGGPIETVTGTMTDYAALRDKIKGAK